MHDGPPLHFLLAATEFHEQRVSGAVGGTRRTNSMACSFPCLKSRTVLGPLVEIATIDRPSVRPHGKTGRPRDGFSWKFIFDGFSKICRENVIFINILQE